VCRLKRINKCEHSKEGSHFLMNRFEFEFRKHRTIKRDVVGLSRFTTSASLDLLSSFLRVKTLDNSLEKPKSALK
jgi:hypothetical protein